MQGGRAEARSSLFGAFGNQLALKRKKHPLRCLMIGCGGRI